MAGSSQVSREDADVFEDVYLFFELEFCICRIDGLGIGNGVYTFVFSRGTYTRIHPT